MHHPDTPPAVPGSAVASLRSGYAGPASLSAGSPGTVWTSQASAPRTGPGAGSTWTEVSLAKGSEGQALWAVQWIPPPTVAARSIDNPPTNKQCNKGPPLGQRVGNAPPHACTPSSGRPCTHQPQALAPKLAVVLLQLFRLLPQLLVVGRDFLLGLNQVIVGQRLHAQLGMGKQSMVSRVLVHRDKRATDTGHF